MSKRAASVGDSDGDWGKQDDFFWAHICIRASQFSAAHRQVVFLVEFNSTPSPNTQVLLASGVIVIGVDDWVTKLANVA